MTLLARCLTLFFVKDYITRDEAAAALGVTLQEVKRRIQAGDLRTVSERSPKNGKPQQLVSREDVEFCIQHAKKTAESAPSPSFAERYTPEDASRMFAALKKGTSVEDCVIELKIHPRAALAIRRAWDDVRGSVTLSRQELDSLEKLGLAGSFPIEKPDALMDVLRSAADERACATCKERPATHCRGCGSRSARVVDKGANGVTVEGGASVRS